MAKKAARKTQAQKGPKGTKKSLTKRSTAQKGRSAGRKPAASKAGARKKASARTKTAKRPAARPKAKAVSPKGRRSKAPVRAKPATRSKAATRSKPATKSKPAPKAKAAKKNPVAKPRRTGGTGRESTLAQTPATGRSVEGRTNPMPTKRSTGTPAGAGDSHKSPALDRERKRLREVDETVPSPPSSLDPGRVRPSAARSGRSALQQQRREHTETSPVLTGGDVDANWEDAYAVGDEAPGGDNPTPDQDRVDDIGRALGIQYADNEELQGGDELVERDQHRWELDPASAEDYPDHDGE